MTEMTAGPVGRAHSSTAVITSYVHDVIEHAVHCALSASRYNVTKLSSSTATRSFLSYTTWKCDVWGKLSVTSLRGSKVKLQK